MRTRHLLVSLVAACATAIAAAQPLPYQSRGTNLGVVNCASSLCHGSASPWKDAHILQNEYITWSRVDKHATRAYAVLFEERSRRIARNLGLAQPPHEAKLCLDCHAYDPPASARGERFKVSDGVSCEGCHGPASPWIESHVAPHATHAGNLAHGLYPTNEPLAQARLCLSCHFGNKDKFVTHRMMGAGHPRLSFELETFAATEPAHYVIDADWVSRKGAWDPARAWAIGQALAATELIDVLLDPKRSRDGLFPELVVFDCHACHHPMSAKRWTPRAGASPGRIRLNDAHFLMLRPIARRVLGTDGANEFAQRVGALHRAVAGDGGETLEAARALRESLESLTRALAARSFTNADLRAIAAALIDDGLRGEYRDYAGAEQATMAIAGLLRFLAERGELASVGKANLALDRLYDVVRDDEKFDPAQMRAALESLRPTLSP